MDKRHLHYIFTVLAVWFIIVLAGGLGYYNYTLNVIAQDKPIPLAAPPSVVVTTPNESKAITLTELERQPFVNILNRIELALTQKQLLEARIEIDQRNFRDAVEAVKKARGCPDCTFDAQRLELIPPLLPKVVPKPAETRPAETKPKP